MPNYPTSLDSTSTLPNPGGTDKQNSPDHAALHTSENQAIIAVETKLGTGATTPASNTLLIGTGAGTSAWSQVTSAQLAASISDETGTGSAVFATSPTLVTPKADVIQEATNNNGVTVDGLNIKDSKLNTNDSVVTTNITNAAVTSAKVSGVDKSLLTTDSNPYKFRARRVAAQNTGNAAFAIVNFDTEDFDTNNNFDITTNVGRYTAPVAGFYQFNSRVSAGSTTQLLIALYKNGTLLERGLHTPGNGTYGVGLNTLVQSAAGDYWEIYSFGSGNAIEVSAAILFSGFLVSRT